MRVTTGKVVAGRVVVEGPPLEEGATVTVIAAEDAETFELAPAEEAALLAAIAEADQGDLLDGAEKLVRMDRGRAAVLGPERHRIRRDGHGALIREANAMGVATEVDALQRERGSS